MNVQETPEVSVVIPCLNEERTVADCVAAAWEGIRASGLPGEVIVADNGSSDGSCALAVKAGARVVRVARRGYGAALQAGFLSARGRLLVMGDADMSYDFRKIPEFVAEQARSGADLVLGNRFGGAIEPGAMPWTHRVIGNPAISWTIRRFFRCRVRDAYCGLRLITRTAHARLPLMSTGMEYALEMVVLASLSGLRIGQVPITLHVDRRDRAPHLRTWRDGYRSFRFLLRMAPITVYWLPGVVLVSSAAVLMLWAVRQQLAGRDVAAAAIQSAGGVLLVGWLMLLLGAIARVFSTGFLGGRVDPALRGVFSVVRLEHGIALSAAAVAAGVAAILAGLNRSSALTLLGVLLLVMAVGTGFGIFVISLMGRAVPDNRFALRAGADAGDRDAV